MHKITVKNRITKKCIAERNKKSRSNSSDFLTIILFILLFECNLKVSNFGRAVWRQMVDAVD